jgi:hypothetical protein
MLLLSEFAKSFIKFDRIKNISKYTYVLIIKHTAHETKAN